MSSELQKIASRRNGARSSGPATEAGKARAARNATTHGLCSSTVVLANESQDLYQQLLAAYQEEWQPKGQTENDLVVELANARWRLRRIWAMETAALDAEMFINRPSFERAFPNHHPGLRQVDAFQSLASEDNQYLDKLNRYETRYTRAFDRAVRNLIHLQKLRGFDSGAPANPQHDPAPPPVPDLPNEPEPSPANLFQLFQRVVLWLVAVVAHLAHSTPARERALSTRLPRNLAATPFTAACNYGVPEVFSWETPFVPKSEAA